MRMSIAPTACRHGKQSQPVSAALISFPWESLFRGSNLMEDYAHAQKRVAQLARPPDQQRAV